jgi:hypothetical protein
MKEYSYISAPSMGLTACTEPQCLYKGAFYLYLYLYFYKSTTVNIPIFTKVILARKFSKLNTESMTDGSDVDGRSHTQGENCFHIRNFLVLFGNEDPKL